MMSDIFRDEAEGESMHSNVAVDWQWKPQKRKAMDDFELGYSKISRVESEEILKETKIKCWYSPKCTSMPAFSTYAEYDEHYKSFHENLCSQCNNILPTLHLLHLHLLERHDSFFATKKLIEKCFECFVEDCKKKFKNSRDRIRHLINAHKFPPDFDFNVIRGVKLQLPENQIKNELNDKTSESKDIVLDLSTCFSKLSIPRSVQLARSKTKFQESGDR